MNIKNIIKIILFCSACALQSTTTYGMSAMAPAPSPAPKTTKIGTHKISRYTYDVVGTACISLCAYMLTKNVYKILQ